MLPRSLFPQSCVSSGGSVVGLMVTSHKRAYVIPRSAASRTPAPAAGHCRTIPPQETLKHGSGYLCGVSGSWCTQGFVCALQESVSPVLFRFWQLCGGVNGNLLLKVPCRHCCTQWPQTCNRSPLTHASAGDSWTFMGKSASVYSVSARFSWVLVHPRFCLCPPRVCFPSAV